LELTTWQKVVPPIRIVKLAIRIIIVVVKVSVSKTHYNFVVTVISASEAIHRVHRCLLLLRPENSAQPVTSVPEYLQVNKIAQSAPISQTWDNPLALIALKVNFAMKLIWRILKNVQSETTAQQKLIQLQTRRFLVLLGTTAILPILETLTYVFLASQVNTVYQVQLLGVTQLIVTRLSSAPLVHLRAIHILKLMCLEGMIQASVLLATTALLVL
jgi:hypothetical protein